MQGKRKIIPLLHIFFYSISFMFICFHTHHHNCFVFTSARKYILAKPNNEHNIIHKHVQKKINAGWQDGLEKKRIEKDRCGELWEGMWEEKGDDKWKGLGKLSGRRGVVDSMGKVNRNDGKGDYIRVKEGKTQKGVGSNKGGSGEGMKREGHRGRGWRRKEIRDRVIAIGNTSCKEVDKIQSGLEKTD